MTQVDQAGVRNAVALDAAWRAIEYAHWRSDPVDRESLMEDLRSAWAAENVDQLRTRLLQLDLAGADRADFVAAIETLVATADTLPSADKGRAERFAFWAVQQLPPSDATPFVRGWLAHRRKGRRALAHKLVRRLGLEAALRHELVAAWQQHDDLNAVRALVRVEGGAQPRGCRPCASRPR